MITVVKMLAVDEGIRYKAYKDTKGNVTVGIGFNMDDPRARGIWLKADIPESFNGVYAMTDSISAQSTLNVLDVCVTNARNDLKTLLPNFSTYPDYVQLALVNLMFNMGLPTFSKFYTFLNLIKEGNYDDAGNHLESTAWYNQVGERASRVMALLKGDDSLYASRTVDTYFNSSQSA